MALMVMSCKFVFSKMIEINLHVHEVYLDFKNVSIIQ